MYKVSKHIKIANSNVVLQDIGLCLLERVCGDGELWVVGEALDAVFDVFSEDHVDPVVKEIDLVPKLKTLAPALKAKVGITYKLLYLS